MSFWRSTRTTSYWPHCITAAGFFSVLNQNNISSLLDKDLGLSPKYNMSIETLAQNVSYSLRRTALIADRRDQTTKKPLSICRKETEWLWLKGETQGQQTEGKQIKSTKSQQNQKLCADKINKQKIYKKVKNNKTASVTVAPPHIRAGLQLTSVSTLNQ